MCVFSSVRQFYTQNICVNSTHAAYIFHIFRQTDSMHIICVNLIQSSNFIHTHAAERICLKFTLSVYNTQKIQSIFISRNERSIPCIYLTY